MSAEWMIPKALWIRQNEPEIFSRVTTICERDTISLKIGVFVEAGRDVDIDASITQQTRHVVDEIAIR